jgi:hypothetical protein
MRRYHQIGLIAGACLVVIALGTTRIRSSLSASKSSFALTSSVASSSGWQEGHASHLIDYDRDVRPILADNCFPCHGPDSQTREAGLRLDLREDAIQANAVVPGNPRASALLRRVTATQSKQLMPPPSTGKKLSDGQIETLRRWIAQGARYSPHWAFVNPVRPPLPEVRQRGWVRNAIDQFVLARLEHEGLAPSPEADRATLIRRVTLDLIGLPPTPTEVAAFLADEAPDAYERLVDRLLASPHFGERMAIEWLDAARYADTNGFNLDCARDMSGWRDWVINAFNSNLPFDQFTIEQLAGDLLPNPTLSQKIATGFNRNNMITNESGIVEEEYQAMYVADRVNTVATVWLGLTIGCARCHDHKYDPISQREYYQLYAYFNTLAETVLHLDLEQPNAAPIVKLPDPVHAAQVEQAEQRVRAAEAVVEQLKAGDHSAAAIRWRNQILPSGATVRWHVVQPKAVRALNGTSFQMLSDYSLLASGECPKQDDYLIEADIPLRTITGFRLEAMPDNRLPNQGPGRAGDGNFLLTDLQVQSERSWRRIAADYSQQQGDYRIESVNRPGGRGWGVMPEAGQTHYAVVEFDKPIPVADGKLRVRLGFHSPSENYLLGRFRLAVTADPIPPLQSDPESWAIAIATSDPGAEKPHADLVRYYREKIHPEVLQAKKEVERRRAEAARLHKLAPSVMVMEEMPHPRATHVLIRGQYNQKGEQVSPGVPGILPALPPQAPANRLGLAQWLVSPHNPLTARVIVNRYWQMYFGTGLVKTVEDFGTQGEPPSHPELLDWLACEFRTRWDVKQLQRLIVTSATYRQSSRTTPELLKRDPENRLLARMTRMRLPAELLRDQALAAAGLLNRRIGGPSVRIYQPDGFWEELMDRNDGDRFSSSRFTLSSGPDLYRRSLYAFWKRTAPPPTLALFDAPDRETCTVRRPRTNTPLQALVLLNDPTYVEAARKLAERVLREGGQSTDQRLAFAFRLCLSRLPTEQEQATLGRFLANQLERFRQDPTGAISLLQVGQAQPDAALNPIDVAAWAVVARAILNLDETVTRN